MQFRAEFTPKIFPVTIAHSDKLMLVGSCFTEQIGRKLSAHKFRTLENPNGILFNPISIAKAVNGYANRKSYTDTELFFFNELWAGRDHHTSFSRPDKAATLELINSSQARAADFIREADWLLLTLGSAFLYEWKDLDDTETYGNVAANCHKVPTDKFNRRLASAEEIEAVLAQMIGIARGVNPKLKIIFTISPVRHLREGFVENNRSKAALIQAVHALTNDSTVFYFPAYELVIDDLRDYRFYAEDLVHPNYFATDYVWEKLSQTVFSEETRALMSSINEINAAAAHKPFNPTSAAHKKFCEANLQRIERLKTQFAYLNFEVEEKFFRSFL